MEFYHFFFSFFFNYPSTLEVRWNRSMSAEANVAGGKKSPLPLLQTSESLPTSQTYKAIQRDLVLNPLTSISANWSTKEAFFGGIKNAAVIFLAGCIHQPSKIAFTFARHIIFCLIAGCFLLSHIWEL